GPRRPRSELVRVAIALTIVGAFHYAVFVVSDLTRTEPRSLLNCELDVLIDLSVVAMMALARHLVPLRALPAASPGRAWLATNYGLAAFVGALIVLRGVPDWQAAMAWSWTVEMLYLASMTFLMLRDMRRLARGGRWLQSVAGETRYSDVA